MLDAQQHQVRQRHPVMRTWSHRPAQRFNKAEAKRVPTLLNGIFIGEKRPLSLEIYPIKTRLSQIMPKGLMPGPQGVGQERFTKFLIFVDYRTNPPQVLKFALTSFNTLPTNIFPNVSKAV